MGDETYVKNFLALAGHSSYSFENAVKLHAGNLSFLARKNSHSQLLGLAYYLQCRNKSKNFVAGRNFYRCDCCPFLKYLINLHSFGLIYPLVITLTCLQRYKNNIKFVHGACTNPSKIYPIERNLAIDQRSSEQDL